MIKASRLWFSCFAIALLLLSSLLASRTTPTAHADAPWSNAISIGGAPSLFPEIATDDYGNIHIVYEATSDDLNSWRRVMYTNNVGGGFKEPAVISNVPGHTISSSPKLDIKDNRVGVTFNSRIGGLLNARMYYVESPDLGVNWAAPVNLSGSVPAFDSTIVIDSEHTTHVAYGGYRGFTTDAVYAIYYTKKLANGGWSAPAIIAERIPGNSYTNYPDLAATTVNGQVTLNLLYMGNTIPGNELNKTVYSMRQIGGVWTAPVLRGANGSNYPKVVSDGGSTLWATWQAAFGTNFEAVQTISTDNGANWSAPAVRSNNSTLSARPDIARALNGSIMMAWDDSAGGSDDKQDIWSAYSSNGASWANPVRIFAAPLFSKEVEVAGSCETFHAVWHDAGSPDAKFRIFYSQTGEACHGTSIPVTFTPSRTSASPTTNPQVQVTLSGITGSPNQLRYSATPFTSDAAAPAWGAMTTSFSVNVGTPENCIGTVYVQARNTNTGETSPVRTASATVDNTIQAPITVQSRESVPVGRAGASLSAIVGQPNAPQAGAPDYTRYTDFYYTVGKEISTCAGTASHKASGYSFTPAAYPYEGFVPFRPFDETSDSSGIGYNEQTLVTTIVVTDTVGNTKTFTQTMYFDDDPPVLSNGGTAAKVGPTTTNDALATVEFTATVTDEGYQTTQPAAAFWGAWVLATDSDTAPTPAQFEQYGKVYSLATGASEISNVLLVNGLVSGAGTRYVHIRFLDGAGNYTESVLTTPAITLEAPVQLPHGLLPLVKK